MPASFLELTLEQCLTPITAGEELTIAFNLYIEKPTYLACLVPYQKRRDCAWTRFCCIQRLGKCPVELQK